MLGTLRLPLFQKRRVNIGIPYTSFMLFGKRRHIGWTAFSFAVGRDAGYTIIGGPYKHKPPGLVGVKMAQEISLFRNGDFEINIPTRDFHTPDPAQLSYGLVEAVRQIVAGNVLYVGCMAGKGRTGLFLAVLCKAFGVKNPVEYVRANYYSHAVETLDQYKYVETFVIPDEVKDLLAQARRAYRFRLRNELTEQPVPSDDEQAAA